MKNKAVMRLTKINYAAVIFLVALAVSLAFVIYTAVYLKSDNTKFSYNSVSDFSTGWYITDANGSTVLLVTIFVVFAVSLVYALQRNGQARSVLYFGLFLLLAAA